MSINVLVRIAGFAILIFFAAGCAGAPDAHPYRTQAREHLSSANELMIQNNPEQALASVKKALKLHQLSNDYGDTIDDMNRLARLSSFIGQKAASKLWIDRALLLEGISDYPERKAETLILAAQLVPEGEGVSWIAEAHRITDSMPSGSKERKRLEARLFQVEGLRATAKKDYRGAVPLFKKALSLDNERNDPLSIATDRASLARNYYLSGQYETALDQFEKALLLDEKLNNHSGIAYDLEGISLAQAGMGRYRESARRMMEAAGVETGLGRLGMARRDVSFARSLFKNIRTPDSEMFQEVLSHWFDPE